MTPAAWSFLNKNLDELVFISDKMLSKDHFKL